MYQNPARTIVFGTFDGESTFVEPFVTQAYLEKTISAWKDLTCCLRAQQNETMSSLAQLQSQQCTDTGVATSRTNALEAHVARLDRKAEALRKEVGIVDHKIGPVLLAHQKAEAEAARVAAAARTAQVAARRAQRADDIAACRIDPIDPWQCPVTSGSEGRPSGSKLPSIPNFTVGREKLDINTFFNLYEMWF